MILQRQIHVLCANPRVNPSVHNGVMPHLRHHKANELIRNDQAKFSQSPGTKIASFLDHISTLAKAIKKPYCGILYFEGTEDHQGGILHRPSPTL